MMLALRGLGAERFVEVGPGKVLIGLAKRTLRDVELVDVEQAPAPEQVRASARHFATIVSVATDLPDGRITNAELAQHLDVSAGLTLDEIDVFVYHQANARITQAVGERLGLDPERVVDCIESLGNASAATPPVALAQAESEGRLRPGARVLVSAFGAGFTWGAGVIDWGGGFDDA